MDAFLNAFEKIRFQEVLGDYRPYREVLCRALERTMRQFGLAYHDEDGVVIVAAVPTFGPFPDVPPALEQLRKHCKLVIISNTDDNLIASNVRAIGVPFDWVITAQQARAYKPSLAIFEHTIDTLGCDPADIVHVAQGFDYDIVPTSKLGWARVWINRNGAEGDPLFGPYHELRDLSGLPDALGL